MIKIKKTMKISEIFILIEDIDFFFVYLNKNLWE